MIMIMLLNLIKLMLLLIRLNVKKKITVKQVTMGQDVEIMVPLKYLSNFSRTLEWL